MLYWYLLRDVKFFVFGRVFYSWVSGPQAIIIPFMKNGYYGVGTIRVDQKNERE